MKVLALESSAKAASVCIAEDGRMISQYIQNSGLTHSRMLMAMAEDMFKNLELRPADIDMIAVAKGPGSFTGIRIGVAAAKGLAWAAGKKVCGVSTLHAMAHHIAGWDGIICPVMDARRGQIYNGKFLWNGSVIQRVSQDRAIAVDELIDEAKNDEKRYLLVGDGAEMCYNKFLDAGLDPVLAPPMLRYQSAWGVAMAADFDSASDPGELTPNYLRLSQAERERIERLGHL